MLRPDEARHLAEKFVPLYAWDRKERYFNVPVQWIDSYMPNFFTAFELGKEINWLVEYYNVLDVNGNILQSGSLNLVSLALGRIGNDHLGWGPNATLWPPDESEGVSPETVVPFELTRRGHQRSDGGWPLDNIHLSAETPVYYYVFRNSDGNIEINYRFFAYRDDIAFPPFLAGIIEDELGGHWGDWEPNVTIVVSPNEVPLYVYFAAHRTNQTDSRLRYPIDSPYQPRYLLWDDVRKDKKGGRPVVLVAAKKHASYFTSWRFNSPNLKPLTSPSPFDPNANYRPQFLNFAEGISFFGYTEDSVGESFISLPFFGELYLGLNWVPTQFVDLNTALWTRFEGKWGESKNSPSTPKPAEHTIRDFVEFYRKLNSLPSTAEGIPIVDFYASDGPRYQRDLGLADNSTIFHNIYYSILRPLGFTKTAEAYNDIRFGWWNSLTTLPVSFEIDESSRKLSLRAGVRNDESLTVLQYIVQWKINDSVVGRFSRSFSPGEFPPGSTKVEELSISFDSLPKELVTASIEVLGDINLPPEPNTGSPRSFDVMISKGELNIDLSVILDAELQINSPQENEVVCDDSVKVSGTMEVSGGSEPYMITCVANGIPADTLGNTFNARIPSNDLIVVNCTIIDGNQNELTRTDSIHVTRVEPLNTFLNILTPQNHLVICEDSVMVTSKLEISGGLNPRVNSCEVNGTSMTVVDTSYVATLDLDSGNNLIIATCIVEDDCGKTITTRDTVTVAYDNIKPYCTFERTESSIKGTFFDDHSGINKIIPNEIRNGTLSVDSFKSGAKKVEFEITLIDPNKNVFFSIDVKDLCRNRFDCDPIFLTLSIDSGILEHQFTFPAIDRFLQINNHGLSRIEFLLNGQGFELLTNEQRAATQLNSYHMPSEGKLTFDLQNYLVTPENELLIRWHC